MPSTSKRINVRTAETSSEPAQPEPVREEDEHLAQLPALQPAKRSPAAVHGTLIVFAAPPPGVASRPPRPATAPSSWVSLWAR